MGFCECRRRTARRGNGSGAGVRKHTYVDTRRRPPTVHGGSWRGRHGADAAALRERIVKVKHSRLALVTLWHEAVAAAEDATHRRSLSQRRAVDLEAKTFKDIARALSRHRTGEPSMPSCPGPLLICVIRPSWLPFSP
jgi:hypothetical protein